MKTKIVYVITSSDKDILLEQLMLSLHSLKYYNPTASVYLVVDQDTKASIKGCRCAIKEYVTDIIAIDTPKEYNNMLRSRWLKTSLREHITGDFLFIDSDTIITDSLEECDNWIWDIAAVIDRHIPVNQEHQYYEYICNRAKDTGWIFTKADASYFNSGVMYVKDNETTRSFYRTWHEYWQEGLKRSVFQDQPTLGKANKKFGYIIKELNGIWNCQIMANGINFLSDAKIVHYFNAERQIEHKSVFYLPSNRQIYVKIKEDKFRLEESIKKMIENGRSAFANNYAIFADEQLKAIRDPFCQFVMKGFFTRNKFYVLLKMMFAIYSRMKYKK